MSFLLRSSSDFFDRSNLTTRAACVVGACCLLVATGARAGSLGTSTLANSNAALWAAPVDQAPDFVGHSFNVDMILSDVRFAAQGWRWSPGSTAWIAVLVRVDTLKAVGMARIGGLYGP